MRKFVKRHVAVLIKCAHSTVNASETRRASISICTRFVEFNKFASGAICAHPSQPARTQYIFVECIHYISSQIFISSTAIRYLFNYMRMFAEFAIYIILCNAMKYICPFRLIYTCINICIFRIMFVRQDHYICTQFAPLHARALISVTD